MVRLNRFSDFIVWEINQNGKVTIPRKGQKIEKAAQKPAEEKKTEESESGGVNVKTIMDLFKAQFTELATEYDKMEHYLDLIFTYASCLHI